MILLFSSEHIQESIASNIAVCVSPVDNENVQLIYLDDLSNNLPTYVLSLDRKFPIFWQNWKLILKYGFLDPIIVEFYLFCTKV